ncbi:polyA polymerase family protein [Histomonas meleagridis]|uniref:polyA polymerase family protein n=1 Tax=Histomonas meleagridis TaxID=135588 RepID=UPI003559F348|nr:polyA polymerase family protein [Histomonas meleagridis]KAH0796828.1 polyA polymerase family protein [Histomonas meleagridis]
MVRQVCTSFTQPVVARFVGGWVRDKLMGKDNDDIDIAIDCDCSTFLEKFEKIFPHTKCWIVRAKPHMSKYLTVGHISISADRNNLDVCALKEYDYNENFTSIGTIESDIRRRDFTINSIYLNVITNKVEDFVGGINDIKNGIIRTILEPKVAYDYDPMIVVRAIRFATVLSFKIEQKAFEGILENKFSIEHISRERVTQEVMKMMKSENVVRGLELMVETNIFNAIFAPPPFDEKEFFNRVKIALSRCNDKSYYLILILSILYKDLSKFSLDIKVEQGKKKKDGPRIHQKVTQFLKMPAKVSRDVCHLLKSVKTVSEMQRPLTRLAVGRWLRETDEVWELTSCLLFDPQTYQFFNDELVPFVRKENLTEVIHMKPFASAKELAKIHGMENLGAQNKKFMLQLIEWQIENPGKTINDYSEYVNSQK